MSRNAKRLAVIVLCALGGMLVLLFVIARTFAGRFEPQINTLVVQYLQEHFDSQVELGDLHISIPAVSPLGLLFRGGSGTLAHVEGHKLSLRHQGHESLPPLFAVDTFSFDLDLGMLRQLHPHVTAVTLNGMTLTIPPKSEQAQQTPDKPRDPNELASRLIVDHVDISQARLIILPNNAQAQPLDFALTEIHVTSAGEQNQLQYRAVLTNPRPPGLIRSTGAFGPWNAANPGDTPMNGIYDFSNADLGIFTGIAGILHSSGHFNGTLSAIRAQGEATVPDFRLKTSGNPVPLQTQYDVLVDGTNGNTILQPVHARLRNTYFVTSGGIIKHEGARRRAIDLDLVMTRGHIEDLLLLAAKGKPFMSGLINMNAKISIPPLGGTMQQKLILSGSFNISRGEFLHGTVQDKVDELSRRGQGKPKDLDIDNVFSSMVGTFHMENQVLTFTRLSFGVPGATVGLHGDYSMAQDTVDFHGDLKLEAKVSQMLSGWKRWLAKPVDPFFAKHGAGTYLKIQVVGSAEKPSFGLDRGPHAGSN